MLKIEHHAHLASSEGVVEHVILLLRIVSKKKKNPPLIANKDDLTDLLLDKVDLKT